MNASELRAMSEADLQKQLLELRKEQFNLRMQVAMSQLPRSHQFSQVRKDIARIKTILNEKSKAEQAGRS